MHEGHEKHAQQILQQKQVNMQLLDNWCQPSPVHVTSFKTCRQPDLGDKACIGICNSQLVQDANLSMQFKL